MSNEAVELVYSYVYVWMYISRLCSVTGYEPQMSEYIRPHVTVIFIFA